MVASGREAERRTGIAGLARITRLSSVDECHGCGLLDVPSNPWTPVTVSDVRREPVFEQARTHGIVNGELVHV